MFVKCLFVSSTQHPGRYLRILLDPFFNLSLSKCTQCNIYLRFIYTQHPGMSAGVLLKRFDARLVMMSSGFLSFIGIIICAMATNAYILLVGCTLAGKSSLNNHIFPFFFCHKNHENLMMISKCWLQNHLENDRNLHVHTRFYLFSFRRFWV